MRCHHSVTDYEVQTKVAYLRELHMRTADVVELESRDFSACDVPLSTRVVIVQFNELRRVGQVDHEGSVRPRPEYHRTFLYTRSITGSITRLITRFIDVFNASSLLRWVNESSTNQSINQSINQIAPMMHLLHTFTETEPGCFRQSQNFITWTTCTSRLRDVNTPLCPLQSAVALYLSCWKWVKWKYIFTAIENFLYFDPKGSLPGVSGSCSYN